MNMENEDRRLLFSTHAAVCRIEGKIEGLASREDVSQAIHLHEREKHGSRPPGRRHREPYTITRARAAVYLAIAAAIPALATAIVAYLS
jgi:hypothetical protein